MKKRLAAAISLGMLLLAAGCSQESESGQELSEAGGTAAEQSSEMKGSGAKINIAFCNVAPTAHPQNIAYRAFADKVKSETGGNIEVTVYDNAQMGNIWNFFSRRSTGLYRCALCPRLRWGLLTRDYW